MNQLCIEAHVFCCSYPSYGRYCGGHILSTQAWSQARVKSNHISIIGQSNCAYILHNNNNQSDSVICFTWVEHICPWRNQIKTTTKPSEQQAKARLDTFCQDKTKNLKTTRSGNEIHVQKSKLHFLLSCAPDSTTD